MDGMLQHYLETHKGKLNSAAIAYLAAIEQVSQVAPDIAASIIRELEDQRSYLKLIASENYSSYAVQLAMGNWLTDKYAEGFPRHRFYQGCDNVDTVEEIAVQEVTKLFGADHAYVQPHSGADANLVAFWSLIVQRVQTKEVERLGKKSVDELTREEYEAIRQLMLNQKVMGMSLNSGGHLTHGYRHNVSSKMMQAICYDVDPNTRLLDYDAIAILAKQERPNILLCGYSAYPRRINFAKMREIADSVGAALVADMAHFSGLVAGKVFTGEENPIPYADIVTSTTHKTLRGPRGGLVLCRKEYAEIVNKGCPLVLGGPLPHVIAAKAVAFREANRPEFQSYSSQIVTNARALAQSLRHKGVSIATGGTDNHLVLIDLTPQGLTGRHVEGLLREAHMTVNRNAIPWDKNGPWYTSGLRLGTPAMTTLGMKEPEMVLLGELIADVILNSTPLPDPKGGISRAKAVTTPEVLTRVKSEVAALLERFPLYPEVCFGKNEKCA